MSGRDAETADIGCLEAALLRLMTRYALHPTADAVAAVVRVLDWFALQLLLKEWTMSHSRNR